MLEDLPGCSLSTLSECNKLQTLTLRRCNLTSLDGLNQCAQIRYIDVQVRKNKLSNAVSIICIIFKLSCKMITYACYTVYTTIKEVSYILIFIIFPLFQSSVSHDPSEIILTYPKRLNCSVCTIVSYIKENSITFVDCGGLANLQVLLLGRNQLMNIHGLDGAENLHILQLSYNNISCISEYFL